MLHDESYFSKEYSHLSEGYTDKSGEYAESCAAIALDLADLLKNEDKETKILAIYGQKIGSNGRREPLIPIAYGGRLEWGAHVVCESDGVIYDPIFESPMPIEEYLIAAFNQKVDIVDLKI